MSMLSKMIGIKYIPITTYTVIDGKDCNSIQREHYKKYQ